MILSRDWPSGNRAIGFIGRKSVIEQKAIACFTSNRPSLKPDAGTARHQQSLPARQPGKVVDIVWHAGCAKCAFTAIRSDQPNLTGRTDPF